MAKLNPFNPNSVVSSSLFAGRAAQVGDICRKLSGLRQSMPTSFFIYGERGIGKTALAKLIRYIASANDKRLNSLNLLTSYYSVESGQSLNSVLQESLNKLSDEMDKNLVKEIGDKLGNIFKNGKFQIGAFGATVGIEVEGNTKSNDITIKDQTVSILSNVIKGIIKDQVKDGILIIIDEFHNLKNLDTAASIFRNIITTLDVEGLGRISFLLIGYEEDVEKFFSRDSSSRRAFDLHRLSVMPAAEAVEVLVKGFESAEVKWDENLLKTKILVTGGYPHSIQIVGQHLIDVDKDDYIDESDWDQAIFDSAYDLKARSFSNMYSFGKALNHKDRILVSLAEKNQPLSKRQLTELTDNKNIYQYIPALKNCGAVWEDDDGLIHLHSQLLRTAILIDQYIRKNEQVTKTENGDK